MMFVSALMVKPRDTHSGFPAADTYRRSVALIVAHALEKLLGCKLRQIVDYAAPGDATFSAMQKHLVFMPENQEKVFKSI